MPGSNHELSQERLRCHRNRSMVCLGNTLKCLHGLSQGGPSNTCQPGGGYLGFILEATESQRGEGSCDHADGSVSGTSKMPSLHSHCHLPRENLPRMPASCPWKRGREGILPGCTDAETKTRERKSLQKRPREVQGTAEMERSLGGCGVCVCKCACPACVCVCVSAHALLQ